jgi:hypothetical protein
LRPSNRNAKSLPCLPHPLSIRNWWHSNRRGLMTSSFANDASASPAFSWATNVSVEVSQPSLEIRRTLSQMDPRGIKLLLFSYVFISFIFITLQTKEGKRSTTFTNIISPLATSLSSYAQVVGPRGSWTYKAQRKNTLIQ